MNLDDVAKRIANIAALARGDDDEGAHAIEDRLQRDVLQAIADGAPDAPALAKAALETQDLEFSRWYA